MFITEPEAGALFAARYLKNEMKKDFLKVCLEPLPQHSFEVCSNSFQPGECFILCDAGGGTVVFSKH
jgi:hypothetical protein